MCKSFEDFAIQWSVLLHPLNSISSLHLTYSLEIKSLVKLLNNLSNKILYYKITCILANETKFSRIRIISHNKYNKLLTQSHNHDIYFYKEGNIAKSIASVPEMAFASFLSSQKKLLCSEWSEFHSIQFHCRKWTVKMWPMCYSRPSPVQMPNLFNDFLPQLSR